MQMKYDVVITGSGLGGLLCGVILAKEGMKVAVIEQNKQVGGCLQTFSFEKKVFDSCVHYVGSMLPGQVQYKIFDYVGINKDLVMSQLDQDCFDQIVFGDENINYPQAQESSNFIEQLSSYFPNKRKALQRYIEVMDSVANRFPLYQLRIGDSKEKEKVLNFELQKTIAEIAEDKRLENVLTGNNLLYAGVQGKTPFYVHSLVMKSYIESSFKFIGGSSQVAKALWKKLQEYGGEIFRNEKVVRLNEKEGNILSVTTESGSTYLGNHFIMNVHPLTVLDWINSPKIKPVYRNRIMKLENSISAFMVNIVLKPGKVKHRNYNIYWNRSNSSFDAIQYQLESWPANYALYFTEDQQNPGFSESVAILTYMHASEMDKWVLTHNRTAQPSAREPSYAYFKNEKANKVIEKVGERYSEIKNNIHSFKCATPLTFRDYMGSPDGSMYGIIHDVNQLSHANIPIRTKIPNLFLTGQNVNLHGVLGVSISAVATCGALTGLDYLLGKINENQ